MTSDKIEPRRNTTIRYVHSEVPDVTLPRYQGERYQALVPDTLDLAERGKLAIHGMTAPTDEENDYEIYFIGQFNYNPPMMFHSASDHVVAKFCEAVPLLRLMTGSTLDRHVEQRWLEVFLQGRLPSGILATALDGRPWGRPGPLAVGGGWRGIPEGDQMVDINFNGNALAAVAVYSMLGDKDLWDPVAQGIVQGLQSLMIDRGDSAYMPKTNYEPGEVADPSDVPPGTVTASYAGWPAHGLLHYSMISGNEQALDMAGKLLRYVLYHADYFEPDGRWLGDDGHFHGHTLAVRGALRYALLAGDREMLDFVTRSYNYARSVGEPLLGFFPEHVISERLPEAAETCCLADMVDISLRMAVAGQGDQYWDDADRWIRNQLAEAQLLQTDWIYRALRATPTSVPRRYSTNERVPERLVGAFQGWGGVNEWSAYGPYRSWSWGEVPGDVQQCCTATGARALYYAWEHILTYDSDRGLLKVNLLLNRASSWADIDSHIPYKGQVDVRVKQPLHLHVRIPEWVEPGEVRAQLNGEDHRISFDGRYADLGPVKPDDVAVLTFPISEREDVVSIERQRYMLVRKGNDVVAVDPPGTRSPIYQRAHYRVNDTRWRQIDRYAPTTQLEW